MWVGIGGGDGIAGGGGGRLPVSGVRVCVWVGVPPVHRHRQWMCKEAAIPTQSSPTWDAVFTLQARVEDLPWNTADTGCGGARPRGARLSGGAARAVQG